MKNQNLIKLAASLGLFFAFQFTVLTATHAQSQRQSNTSVKKVDYIVVRKHESRMYLVKDGKVLYYYRVAFGANPVGHKVQAGDERTPEGRYTIAEKRTYSQFYKSLLISYPNKDDVRNARKRGVDPGGNIMIHGIPNNFSFLPDFIQSFQDWLNWTDGCIAVTNREMDQIYDLIHVGIPIFIRP